jgi:hypothetical protein
MNVVRFKVKPGRDQQFLEHNRKPRSGFAGFLGARIIKTGEQTYCLVGEWKSQQSLVKARPQMITHLDGMRDLLEDLGGGLGVTDPVSGEVVAKMPPAKASKRAAKKAVKRSTGARSTKKKSAKRSR